MGRWRFAFVGLGCALVALVAPRAAKADVAACIAAFEEAQVEAKHGKLLAARSRLWICSDAACPGPVRADCTKMRDDLEHAIPTIAIVVRDTNGADVTAKITLDGLDLAVAPGKATPIDPGKHVVTYARAGQEPVDQVFTVVEGEKSRSLVLVAKVVEPPPPATKPSVEPKVEPHSGGRGPWPWVLIGGGAALGATGVVYFSTRYANYEDRKDAITERSKAHPNATDAEKEAAQSEFENLKSKEVVAAVAALGLGAAGAAAIVVGIVLLTTDAKPSARVTVVPHLAGADIVGSF